MRILFDHGTPAPLRRHLPGHSVETAFDRGWATLKNGDLLEVAAIEGFELLVTTDQNLKYQQDLTEHTIAILVLLSTSWPRIRGRVSDIVAVIDQIQPGEYREFPV